MFKLVILSGTLIALSQAIILRDSLGRIGSGFNAQQLTPKCFTTVHIAFPDSDISRKCGGCLIASNKVLTTGNCVTNAQDGNATSIQFTFGGGNPSNGQRGYGVSKISFAPGYNYTIRNSTNNLAVLTLNKTVKFNPRLDAAVPYYNTTQDAFVDQQLLVCGYGNINNNQKRPNSLQCTYLTVVPGTVCNPAFTTTAAPSTTTAASTTTNTDTTTTVATTTAGATTTAASASTTSSPVTDVPIICTQNLDDSNACQGDQGSPVFIQIGTEWTLVGIVSTFANARPNAPCLDGHNTIITQLGGLSSWISKA